MALEKQSTARAHFKLCLLGADFNTNNMGVSALAVGTITCVLHQFPTAEIILLGYAKKGFTQQLTLGEREVSLEFVNMRFSKKFYLSNNIAMLIVFSLGLKLIPSRNLRNKLIRRNACLRHIEEADVIASMAGGDSFSDIYGLRRFFAVSLSQLLAIFMGKKLILLPQTLGPYKGKIVRAIAKYILSRAQFVYSRDYTGLRNMKHLVGPTHDGRLRFSPDVAFVLEPSAPARTDLIGLAEPRREDSVLVGINISGLLSMGGPTRANVFGLRVEYDRLIYDLIDFLIAKKAAYVVLIPHVFGLGGQSDVPACEKTYAAFRTKYPGKIGYVRGTYNQSEIKHIIGRCDFFVGSRMHACIAALSQNIPAVAIAYSDKFLGVMETVGAHSLVADARTMSAEEILEVVKQAFQQRASLGSELRQKMPSIRQAVLGLFRDMPVLNGMSLRRASLLDADREQEQSGRPRGCEVDSHGCGRER
ncbi:MAG: hypothetical protein A3G20_06515 [Acidobacteria bacterium RIFCSPLOWO2_12_FULL_59_11]|nr:MAG: hypothetical protein A3G20_06515 [Acidobacteria bacterium RIFCSPLOWO2_12_FULL_59_11]